MAKDCKIKSDTSAIILYLHPLMSDEHTCSYTLHSVRRALGLNGLRRELILHVIYRPLYGTCSKTGRRRLVSPYIICTKRASLPTSPSFLICSANRMVNHGGCGSGGGGDAGPDRRSCAIDSLTHQSRLIFPSAPASLASRCDTTIAPFLLILLSFLLPLLRFEDLRHIFFLILQ